MIMEESNQIITPRKKRFCINCGRPMLYSKRHTIFVCDRCGVEFRIEYIKKRRGRR